MKFTPKPWRIRKWPSIRNGSYARKYGTPLFEVSSDKHIFWVAGVGAPDEDIEIAKANARLIIAAPELYESLKKLLQLIAEGELIEKEVSHYIPLLVEEAWLALAKAEGKVVN